ncbi:myeloid leukemia factor 1 isoform X2 [Dunckerocampus dactyliophorus]|uniref:myeloid leukemia factor 1 isoform X2 n=1 Tax=Dunckerocampus dactyliophorus TaxID=161453 RepID=UPI002406B6BB|nr:myeloid leukemia factor 1 isoform X2 [Dunckerocampus dactyliophorus]
MFSNGNFRDIDDDPFFSDPFRAHRDHMRQMMRSFSEPFGSGPFMPSITDGRNRGHDLAERPTSPPSLRGEHRDMMMNPFSMFDNMMVNMRTGLDGMHKNLEMSADPNTHTFSSSSVMTYSKVGNEPPKVFQASSSTRHAPGGVKETVRALKDSESGMEKMSIGHHIQDRGHVVEKKMNKKTGEKEFIQDFQNMDESEAESFDEEWQQELSKFKPTSAMSRLEPRCHHGGQRAALTGPERAHRDQPKAKTKSNVKASSSTKQ